MQRALFLTSNLCGIWCHGEFGNKESAIQGTGALTGAWWSVSLRLLLVSTLNFPPLVCNTKTGPKERKICHPHCASLKLLQLTTPLPCGKTPFYRTLWTHSSFTHSVWVLALRGLTPPPLLEPACFSMTVLSDSPSSLHSQPTHFSKQPDVCLQLS